MSDRRPNYEIDSPSHLNTLEAQIAKEVALQFISKKVGRHIKSQAIRKEVDTLLRITQELESKHGIMLNNMCNTLNLNADNANRTFNNVAETIMSGGINWGRIALIYAFGGKVAEHCVNTHNEQLIDNVVTWVGNNVAKKSLWIRDSGNGWNGFLEKFPDVQNDTESSWFQGIFAATIGLGTLAAVLYIKS